MEDKVLVFSYKGRVGIFMECIKSIQRGDYFRKKKHLYKYMVISQLKAIIFAIYFNGHKNFPLVLLWISSIDGGDGYT